MSHGTATPYIASYVIFRHDGKVAFVLRSNTSWMDNHYSLPAGKVERGESFLTAAVREAKEEVGVNVHPEDLEQCFTMHRIGEGDDEDWVDIAFEASKWDGKLYNAEPHRHSELVWLDPLHLPENMVGSVRFMFEQMSAGEHYGEYGWK